MKFKPDISTGGGAVIPTEAETLTGAQRMETAKGSLVLEVRSIGERWHILEVAGRASLALGSYTEAADAIECVRIINLLIDQKLIYPRSIVTGLLAINRKLRGSAEE